MRRTLGYNTGWLYRAEIYDLIYADGNTWDFKHGNDVQTLNVAPDLAKAMTYNPHSGYLSPANGYFDLATPFFATQYVPRAPVSGSGTPRRTSRTDITKRAIWSIFTRASRWRDSTTT